MWKELSRSLTEVAYSFWRMWGQGQECTNPTLGTLRPWHLQPKGCWVANICCQLFLLGLCFVERHQKTWEAFTDLLPQKWAGQKRGMMQMPKPLSLQIQNKFRYSALNDKIKKPRALWVSQQQDLTL